MSHKAPTGHAIDISDTLARHPKKKWKTRRDPISEIFVHSFGMATWDPWKTARYHIGENHIVSSGCPGICYHDCVSDDGTVMHCTDYSKVTWHTRGHNYSAIGVLMLYPGGLHAPPPDAMLDSTAGQCAALVLSLGLAPGAVRGHREAASAQITDRRGSVRYKKTCPGMAIDLDDFRDEVTRKAQIFLKGFELYSGQIDGIWGKLSAAGAISFLAGQAGFDRGGYT